MPLPHCASREHLPANSLHQNPDPKVHLGGNLYASLFLLTLSSCGPGNARSTILLYPWSCLQNSAASTLPHTTHSRVPCSHHLFRTTYLINMYCSVYLLEILHVLITVLILKKKTKQLSFLFYVLMFLLQHFLDFEWSVPNLFFSQVLLFFSAKFYITWVFFRNVFILLHHDHLCLASYLAFISWLINIW